MLYSSNLHIRHNKKTRSINFEQVIVELKNKNRLFKINKIKDNSIEKITIHYKITIDGISSFLNSN